MSSRAIGVVAVAAVLAVAGCGGSSGSASSTSSTASSAGSSTSAAPSTSSSSSAVPAGGSVDSTAVITPVVNAVKAAKTGHAELTGVTSGTEDFELSKGLSATFTVQGMKLQMVALTSVLYIKGLGGSTKWLKIDPHGTSAMDKAMSSVGDLSKSSDPTTMVRLLSGAKGTKVGSETVSGKPTTHYHFVIPPSSYAKAMGSGALASALKQPVQTDLWVGADNLPVQATSALTTNGKTTTSHVAYSDWGKPVTVSAPPASQVTTSIG